MYSLFSTFSNVPFKVPPLKVTLFLSITVNSIKSFIKIKQKIQLGLHQFVYAHCCYNLVMVSHHSLFWCRQAYVLICVGLDLSNPVRLGDMGIFFILVCIHFWIEVNIVL